MIALDPKLAFYLKHQAQIDEWAQLASLATEHAHGFLLGLDPRLAKRAEGLPGAPRPMARQDGNWHKLLLCDPAWPADGERPLVGVGLDWQSTTARLRRPLVALWVDRRHPAGARLSDGLRGDLANLAKDNGFLQRTWHPLYRHVEPRPRFWEDLDAHAERIVEAVATAWTLLSGPVTASVRNLPPEPTRP